MKKMTKAEFLQLPFNSEFAVIWTPYEGAPAEEPAYLTKVEPALEGYVEFNEGGPASQCTYQQLIASIQEDGSFTPADADGLAQFYFVD